MKGNEIKRVRNFWVNDVDQYVVFPWPQQWRRKKAEFAKHGEVGLLG